MSQSLSVFATINNAERRAHAETHLQAFTKEWLPLAHPEVNIAAMQQPLSLLADLYPAIYLYGPHGEAWLTSLKRMINLIPDDTFLYNLLDTFGNAFDPDGRNAIDQDSRSKELARSTHRHATDHVVEDLVYGKERDHIIYTVYGKVAARVPDLTDLPTGWDHNDYRMALAYYSYYFLLQDIFQQNAWLAKQTTLMAEFLTNWDLNI